MSVGQQLGSPRALLNQMFFHDECICATTTPFVSAPSSPTKSCHTSGALFVANAPTSPRATQLQLKLSLKTGMAAVVPIGRDKRLERGDTNTLEREENASFSMQIGSDFDFSARFSETDGAPMSSTVMSSADELFYNGQIRSLQAIPEPYRSVSETVDDECTFDFRKSANYDVCALHSPVSPKVHQGNPSMLINRPTYQQPYNPVAAWEQWNCVRDENQIASSQLIDNSKERKHVLTQKTTLRQGAGARRIPRSADDLLGQTRRTRDVAKKFTKSADPLPELGRHGKQERFVPNSGSEERNRSTRITRSLSPLRVFHWEDRHRQSCESEGFFSATSSIDGKDHFKGSNLSSPKKSKARTLKELLGISDGRVHHRQSSQNCTESSYREKPSKPSVKATGSWKVDDMNVARGAPQTIAAAPQRSKHILRSPRGAVSPHELHYAQQRAQAEQMRKKTFLPYRQGVLGCLGFSYSTRSQ